MNWLVVGCIIVVIGQIVGYAHRVLWWWRYLRKGEYPFPCPRPELDSEYFRYSLWGLLCIYLLTQFVMWVFGWHTEVTVKVTFLIMCGGIIGFFVALSCLDSELLADVMGCIFLAGGASCAVFKWVPDTTWQVVIVCVIALLLIRGVYKIYIYHTKPYIVGIGDHCEIVRGYASKSKYNDAQMRERENSGYRESSDSLDCFD